MHIDLLSFVQCILLPFQISVPSQKNEWSFIVILLLPWKMSIHENTNKHARANICKNNKKKSRCIHLVEPWISFATCKSVWGFFKIMKKKPPYDPDTRFLDIDKKG